MKKRIRRSVEIPTQLSEDCSLVEVKKLMASFFAQSQSEYHEIRSLHYKNLPRDPERFYGSEWKGWKDLFADSCMKAPALLELMKENRLFDFEMLKSYQMRMNNQHIPRNPRNFYTTKDAEWLRLQLTEFRRVSRSRTVTMLPATSHRESAKPVVRRRLYGSSCFPYHHIG